MKVILSLEVGRGFVQQEMINFWLDFFHKIGYIVSNEANGAFVCNNI